MELTSKTIGKWTVVHPTGYLSEDHFTNDLEKVCLEKIRNGETWLAFDLSAVPFINSTVLRVFILCQKLLKERSGGVAILYPQKNVLEVIEVCGLHKIIPVCVRESELLL